MIKTHFMDELRISDTQSKGGNKNNKKDVIKLQSWLNLFELSHPGSGTSTGIDGDFGPATDEAVKKFQEYKKLKPDGKVTQDLFSTMTEPMRNAFTAKLSGKNLRELVINTAMLHLKNRPFELVVKRQNNCGPWVRSYMNGNEGESWYWCMGFVQTVLDQAATVQDKNFKKLMPLTFSCDSVGMTGLQSGALTRYTKVRQDPSVVKPGDIFLLQKTTFDWVHTGIIIGVKDDIFETIEGNTNAGGSANGNAVMKRIRNYKASKLDVFSIEALV